MVPTGDGLARAVSDTVPAVRHHLRLLSRDSKLRAEEYIRVCGGFADAGAVEVRVAGEVLSVLSVSVQETTPDGSQ